MPNNQEKINVFISYAHEDEEYIEKLKVYLHEETCPDINVWYDGEINPGQEWDDEIKGHLEGSHIILLLISQHFLISDYIKKVELKAALKKHEQKQCRVIPIFTKPCKLESLPQIAKIQGMPKGMRFLSSLKNELDGELAEIQKVINEIALTELNFRASKKKADEEQARNETIISVKSEKANAIDALRNKQKIFLSLAVSPEAKDRRFELIIQAEGKKRYKNWPYEIVPGIEEAEQIEKMSDEDKTEKLSLLLKESVYSIHIVEAENDLQEGSSKLQYDLMKSIYPDASGGFFKTIIWPLTTELRGKIDKTFSMHNSIISEGYGALFSEIARFDAEKEKFINKLTQEFLPQKRIYMYYEFASDHNNENRITLKTRFESMNYTVRVNTPDEDVKSEREELESCDAGVVFYGAAEPKWFMVKQASLLKAKNLIARCVYVDEPEIKTKCERDINMKEFIVVRSNDNDNPGGGFTNFFNGL